MITKKLNLNRVKRLSKRLAQELQQASHTLLEIGDQYLELFNITSDFNKKAKVGKNRLESVFSELNKTVKNWSIIKINIIILISIGEHIQTQVTSIRKNLMGFYSHASYEAQSYKDVKKIIE